jgi:hypothetical protein
MAAARGAQRTAFTSSAYSFTACTAAYDTDTLRDRYCSSDIWSGDAPASNATFGYTFRGSRIVAAVMTGLMKTQGLGSKPGQRLLFGGCSAGAIGAMNNIEAVAAMMPATVQTWGFLDGAGLLDIQPRGWNWRPELETLQSLMASMLGFTQPIFPAYCSQLFPGELYKCLIGQYRMPLITAVPYFVNVPQYDMCVPPKWMCGPPACADASAISILPSQVQPDVRFRQF